MNEYERTKKWLADYLKVQFVSDEAPDDECVRESEFILSNPSIQVKADEQIIKGSIFSDADDILKLFDCLWKDGFIKVVKKEAQDDR